MYYYVGFIFVTWVYPLIVMMIAKVLLEFLVLLHKNEELIKTINYILQVFPEAVLIQAFDEESKEYIIKFANNEALKAILNYGDSKVSSNSISYISDKTDCEYLNKPIDEERLHYIFTNIEKRSKHYSGTNVLSSDETLHLSELLLSHVDSIHKGENEIVSGVQLNFNDKSKDSKYFNAKTVKVKWESYQESYIHVFVNTTHIK